MEKCRNNQWCGTLGLVVAGTCTWCIALRINNMRGLPAVEAWRFRFWLDADERALGLNPVL